MIIMVEDFNWWDWLPALFDLLYMVVIYLIVPFLPNR